MKQYQDHDPLHGNGKATPKPKSPTRYSYRGARFGSPVSINRDLFNTKRSTFVPEPKATAFGKRCIFSVVGLIAACLGFNRGR